jgi:hypothetical protein
MPTDAKRTAMLHCQMLGKPDGLQSWHTFAVADAN